MAHIIIKPKTHQEWLDERTKGIGSSEAGTIMGVNKYDTALSLWRRKTGLDAPIEENEAMMMGHLLEPIVAMRWEIETGNRIIKNTAGDWIAVDTDRPFLRVSPDRLYWIQGEKKNAKNRGILECKTTSIDIDPDDIPLYWYCQLQYQLGVMGLKEGCIAWLINGRKFGYKFFKFNEEFYIKMRGEIEKFWHNNICLGTEPEATTAEDILLKYVRSTDDKELEADAELVTELRELAEVKSDMNILDSKKKMLEDAIKLKMQDAERITCDGNILATWKTAKDKQTFDLKSFSSAHPDLYKQFLKTTTGNRTFLNKIKQ